MKYAILSDIHANLQALETVLEDIDKASVDELVFLGDAVGYGANPNEATKLIGERAKILIRGNHDAGALGIINTIIFNNHARAALDFTESVLSDDTRQILSRFKMSQTLDGMHLVHAAPGEPERWNYCHTPYQAENEFEHFDSIVCFFGHSHVPVVYSQAVGAKVEMGFPQEFVLEPESKYIINVGSVGQPRDGDSRACYLIYDSDNKTVQYRRVSYDISAAQSAMASQELPNFLIDRLTIGK